MATPTIRQTTIGSYCLGGYDRATDSYDEPYCDDPIEPERPSVYGRWEMTGSAAINGRVFWFWKWVE